MASTSSSHQQNAFSGIEPLNKRRKIEESSGVFDVFINHRGPDVKQTLATKLHNFLKARNIRAFLDSEEKELGESFPSSIEAAIRSASVHIAIFSKGYAESAWCLAELVLMLQTNAKIIPLFYQVEPWELRYIEEGKGAYAGAFLEYEKKGRYLDKLKEWKEVLQKISYTAGVKINPDSSDSNDIASTVEKEVQRKRHLQVAKYPVGLDKIVEEFERRCLDKLVQDFETQCGMNKANMVGIFGMGGVGKTTLSLELFNKKKSKFTRASFLRDVREAFTRGTLPLLQSKLLEDIFREGNRSFPSNNDGTSYLRHCFERSNSLSFLIILDDIDHLEQLDALLPMDILNKHGNGNHLVIVTTRNVGVLVSAGIDTAYPLKGLDREDGRELFCWHAFDQPLPLGGYEHLVEAFVNVCGGLPLSLIVLGRHVFRRAKWYWQDELEKVKEILPTDIKNRLKISIDRLDDVEKQIFMDIACFFIGKSVTNAMLIWKGSGWRARHALETLKERCLVEEEEDFWIRIEDRWESSPAPALRMHDHLRDLGREMADELSYPHRMWRAQELKCLELKGFQSILTELKSRIFHSVVDNSIGCQITYFLGKPKDGYDASLLWLQLEYLSFPPIDLNLDIKSSIPSWVPHQNLQCLEIKNGCFQKLWQSDVQSEISLKMLFIKSCPALEELPSPSELNCLEKIEIEHCEKLQNITLPTTLVSLSVFRCSHLKRIAGTSDLKRLVISVVPALEQLPSPSELNCLEEIEIAECDKLQNITLPTTLISLSVYSCTELKRIAGTSHLKRLVIESCPALEELPSLSELNCLEEIEIEDCEKLHNITQPTTLISLSVSGCSDLKRIAGTSNLKRLVINRGPALEELPSPSELNCLEVIEIEDCEKLQNITLPTTLTSLSVSGCSDLKRIAGTSDLKWLVIESCPALEQLPSPSELNCLEEIEIRDCQKLQNITLPTTLMILSVGECRVLSRIAEIADLVKLTRLCIDECPQLELPCLGRLICSERIEIDSCQNPQITSAIEEIHVPRYARLSYCGYSLTRYFIDRWKSLPERTYLVGKAVDGAGSSLNEHLFSGANIAVDGVTEISSYTDNLFPSYSSGLRAVIVCFAVIDSSTLAEEMNEELYSEGHYFKMRQGESIIAIVQHYDFSGEEAFPIILMSDYGILKKGFRVDLKEGEESKSLRVLRTIVDRLYDKE